MLGITKAYTTRVGSGPFPTELFDPVGEHLASVGHEFGATTGRPRRCGWFDAIALRRSIEINSVSGLCLTKLDVLDRLDTIKVCVGYQRDDEHLSEPPLGADAISECTPVYEDLPGWHASTEGIRAYDALPANARAYVHRIEELTGTPVDIISTGPDRDDTIVLRNPLGGD